MIKTIPKKKKCKKAKWLSEKALQIAEKGRDVKGKEEKQRYIHLNAEFAFFNDQCKEIRKTIEWERLEISSRKLIYQGNISCKDGHNKGQKWCGHNRSRIY